MQVLTFPLGSLQTNAYLIQENGCALVVDPGGDPARVLHALDDSGARLEAIINTHLHFDHTGGNAALAEATGAPILAPEADAMLLDTELGQGGFMGLPRITPFEYTPLELGEQRFCGLACQVLPTPGHSPGSVSLYFPDCPGGGCVFVGDLIFARSIGRTDFPGGNMYQLTTAVRDRIFTLPRETVIYPGHGPSTTVGDEKLHNPFFMGGEGY